MYLPYLTYSTYLISHMGQGAGSQVAQRMGFSAPRLVTRVDIIGRLEARKWIAGKRKNFWCGAVGDVRQYFAMVRPNFMMEDEKMGKVAGIFQPSEQIVTRSVSLACLQ